MWHFIVDIGLVLGLLVAIVLLFFPQKHQSGNWLLGISIFTLWYGLFMSRMYSSNSILDFPHLSRTGNLLVFITVPTFYLFTRYIFYRDKQLQKWDWILFIPAIFYLIDYLPYYFQSAEAKLISIREDQLKSDNFLFHEGWLTPDWFQYYSRQVWSLFIILLIVRFLVKNRYVFSLGIKRDNRPIFILICAITFFYSISFFPGFTTIPDDYSWYNMDVQEISIAFTLIGLGLFLIFHPKYLYGFFWESEYGNSQAETVDTTAVTEPKVTNEVQPPDDVFGQLDTFMKSTKAYLTIGYTINDLSKDTGIPVYKISPAINSSFKANFNQWINFHRVNEFEQLVKDGLYERQTIDALSTQCGFSNRATFVSSFKKWKGATPSAFIKAQESR